MGTARAQEQMIIIRGQPWSMLCAGIGGRSQEALEQTIGIPSDIRLHLPDFRSCKSDVMALCV